MPRRRAWQPVQVFLPGESHGQRSLVGYSPQGRLESDPTEVMVWTHAEYLEKVQHSGWQTGTRRNLWEPATWRLVCGRAEGADGTRLRGSRCWRESAVSRASARPPPGQLGLPLGREVPRAHLSPNLFLPAPASFPVPFHGVRLASWSEGFPACSRSLTPVSFKGISPNKSLAFIQICVKKCR